MRGKYQGVVGLALGHGVSLASSGYILTTL